SVTPSRTDLRGLGAHRNEYSHSSRKRFIYLALGAAGDCIGSCGLRHCLYLSPSQASGLNLYGIVLIESFYPAIPSARPSSCHSGRFPIFRSELFPSCHSGRSEESAFVFSEPFSLNVEPLPHPIQELVPRARQRQEPRIPVVRSEERRVGKEYRSEVRRDI